MIHSKSSMPASMTHALRSLLICAAPLALTALGCGSVNVEGGPTGGANHSTGAGSGGSGSGGGSSVGCGEGEITVLASNQDEPYAIALDDTNVYWGNLGSGEVMTMPKSGGTPVVFASDVNGVTALAVTSTHVYWSTISPTDGSGGVIYETPKAGGKAKKQLASKLVLVNRIAVGDDRIYWTSLDGLWSALKSGGGANLVAQSKGEATLGFVRRHLAHADAVSCLVRGLQRLLQAREARAIEAEAVGGAIELGALFRGDHAVLDHLGEELFVVRLEAAEAHGRGELAGLEGGRVLERRGLLAHGAKCRKGEAASTSAADAGSRSSSAKLGRCAPEDSSSLPCSRSRSPAITRRSRARRPPAGWSSPRRRCRPRTSLTPPPG